MSNKLYQTDYIEKSIVKKLNSSEEFKILHLQLEEHFSIPEQFMKNLLEDDDWSFVIKTHALIESAVSKLLELKFPSEGVNDIFSRLEMSNIKIGKLAFLSTYNLLDKKYRGVIQKLSELRNNLVHNIENVTFSFTEYFRDNKKFEDLYKAFKFNATDGISKFKIDFFENPKAELWFTILEIITILNREYQKISYERSLRTQMYKYNQTYQETEDAIKDCIKIFDNIEQLEPEEQKTNNQQVNK